VNIQSPSQHRHVWLVGLGVAAVVFVLLFSTATSVGVTWDEPIYSQAAENAARWFGVLVHGGSAHCYGAAQGWLSRRMRSAWGGGWSMNIRRWCGC
jgi:hypothetical protein